MKFLPQKFNDTLALVLLLAVFGIIVATAAGWLPNTPEVVIGALIVTLADIRTFYFRKREPGQGPNG